MTMREILGWFTKLPKVTNHKRISQDLQAPLQLWDPVTRQNAQLTATKMLMEESC